VNTQDFSWHIPTASEKGTEELYNYDGIVQDPMAIEDDKPGITYTDK